MSDDDKTKPTNTNADAAHQWRCHEVQRLIDQHLAEPTLQGALEELRQLQQQYGALDELEGVWTEADRVRTSRGTV